jgi:hypothetical protein
VFSQLSIENATKIEYNPDIINPNAKKSIGIDPSFGSSKFAIVITQYVDGKIQVIHAEEYDRPNFTVMIDTIWQRKQKCGHITNIYCDAANPEVWESLKREFNEPFNQQYMASQIADCKKYNLHFGYCIIYSSQENLFPIDTVRFILYCLYRPSVKAYFRKPTAIQNADEN